MDVLYKTIESLCRNKNVTVTTMCKESGVPRSALSDFKAGRIKSLSAEKLQKIAKYFDVSVDYLLGKTDIKKHPPLQKAASYIGKIKIGDEAKMLHPLLFLLYFAV